MNRLFNIIVSAALVSFAPSCGNRGDNGNEHGHDHGEEMGHGHIEGEEHSHRHAEEHGGEHEGAIEFSREQAEAAGLRTEIAAPRGFSGVFRTGGEILPALGDEATVTATASGIVSFSIDRNSRTRLVPGAKVLNGSTLMWVSAKEMPDGDPAGKAEAAYIAAKKEYERASSLAATGAVSQKALEQAELAFKNALAEYEAFKDRYGDNGVELKSKMTGYVKQLLVNEGDYVSAGQPVAVITQNRYLQLRADVPERYFGRIASVSGANFRPSYSSATYSVKNLGGRKVSAGKASASGTFYIPVIFEFPNTGDFLPGAYADVYLIDSYEDNVISVPESALTEEQGVYFVYIKVCEEDYKKQEVKTGRSDGIRREILSGIDEGDEVVVEGVFQVKLASVSGVVPEGHSHNH